MLPSIVACGQVKVSAVSPGEDYNRPDHLDEYPYITKKP